MGGWRRREQQGQRGSRRSVGLLQMRRYANQRGPGLGQPVLHEQHCRDHTHVLSKGALINMDVPVGRVEADNVFHGCTQLVWVHAPLPEVLQLLRGVARMEQDEADLIGEVNRCVAGLQ